MFEKSSAAVRRSSLSIRGQTQRVAHLPTTALRESAAIAGHSFRIGREDEDFQSAFGKAS
jgi:hypothetical protein